MYILDTDHLGILQRRRGHEFDQLVQKIAAIGDVNVYVTIVSFHEIVSCWTKFVKQSQDSQKVVTGYARLHKNPDRFLGFPGIAVFFSSGRSFRGDQATKN